MEGVQQGSVPLKTALEVARIGDANSDLGEVLEDACNKGQLKEKQIIEAKRLVEKRAKHGPGSSSAEKAKPPTTNVNLVLTYQ